MDTIMHEDPISIVIADDQKLFAEGLKYILESRTSNIRVSGIAENGIKALELAREVHQEIILMDIRMPELDGVEATRLILQEFPEIKILMLTTFDDDEYVETALKNGSVGYLLKNRPPHELIHSIHALRDGTIQLDPNIAKKLFTSRFSLSSKRKSSDVIAEIKNLTKREREVLNLLVLAMDNRQIAGELHVSEATVRNYISTIYGKLGTSNRLEIINILEDYSI